MKNLHESQYNNKFLGNLLRNLSLPKGFNYKHNINNGTIRDNFKITNNILFDDNTAIEENIYSKFYGKLENSKIKRKKHTKKRKELKLNKFSKTTKK